MDKIVTEHSYMDSNKENEVYGRKSILSFTIFIFIACLLAGCLRFFYQHQLLPFIELSAFFLFGWVYAVFLNNRSGGETAVFSLAIFMAFALAFFLGIFYFIRKSFVFTDVLVLSAAFLLPNVILEAWRVYLSTSSGPKQPWVYSKDIPEQPLFVYLENKPVTIELLIGDEKPLVITSYAPLSLKLGMAIFYILKKEAEVNAGQWQPLFLNSNGEPYRWLFYTTSFGLIKTYFQPEETLSENKIKSNTVITARRLD